MIRGFVKGTLGPDATSPRYSWFVAIELRSERCFGLWTQIWSSRSRRNGMGHRGLRSNTLPLAAVNCPEFRGDRGLPPLARASSCRCHALG